jgi:probable F420-dependent oxidoreductase
VETVASVDQPSAIARTGRFGLWSALDHMTTAAVSEYASYADALGFDTLWTRDSTGRDAFGLLSFLAPKTSRIRLGLGIASIYARDAFATRAASMTLHEVSEGRCVLGLGISHRQVVEDIRGHGYGPPVATMSAYIDRYEAAPYRGPTPYGAPPLVVAALRRKMLRLAATRSLGAFPYFVPESYVPAARATIDAAAEGSSRRPLLLVPLAARLDDDAKSARRAAGRYVDYYLSRPNYVASLIEHGFSESDVARPGSDRLVTELVALGSADDIRNRLGALFASGADHVALLPLDHEGNMADMFSLAPLAPPW